MKKLFSFFSRLTVVLLAIFLCISLFLNLYTRVSLGKIEDGYFIQSGYACAIVTSGSMENAVFKDDLILIKGASSYKKGEIATYVSEKGTLITHRVIEVTENGYVMKGDANNSPDGEISRQRFMGRVYFVVPAVGLVINELSSPVGLIFLAVFSIGLFLILKITKKPKKEEGYPYEI